MSQLIVGVARANITPPVGMLMSGYSARKTPAVGIHDELHTVVLYLTDGTTEAALVTVDVIGIDFKGTARVREACTAASEVPVENILIACSHTHGGPQTALNRSDSDDELKQAYSTVLVHKIAGALSEAKLNATSVRMGHGRQDCSFGMNRRERKPDGTIVLGVNPEGPTAPFTDVIRLDRLDTDEPMALVFSYACHGTNLGGDNLLYTADYPGVAKRLIDKQFPTALALFVAGCSGDINPHPRGDFNQCERHGKQLGCASVQAALDIEDMVEDTRLAVAHHEFALQLEEPNSFDEAKELAEALEQGETDLAIPMEAQALAIGDCAIVGMPGEIFVKIGLAVAEQSPFARTIPISHANGSIGYVPTADQVPLGGYEVERARARRYGLFIVPESDQAMIDGSLSALRKCYDALAKALRG